MFVIFFCKILLLTAQFKFFVLFFKTRPASDTFIPFTTWKKLEELLFRSCNIQT